MKKRPAVILSALLFLTAGVPAAEAENLALRIGLVENAASAGIACDGDFRAVDLNTQSAQVFSGRGVYNVTAYKNSIKIKDRVFSAAIELHPVNSADRIKINNRNYRGMIKVISRNPGN